jgi:molecular chaperone HtpG
MSEPKQRPFQADVSRVLRLVVNSLYSNKEIFLRELVSNASDALDKLRFDSLSHPELLPEGTDFRIRIVADPEKKTLTISDNGIGMDEAALEKNLGTIAHSGTREFLEKLEQAKDKSQDIQLIGQFGVGFYSGFLVAQKVEVISRAAGTDQAFRWISDAGESYTIEAATRAEQGTDVILHVTDEHAEFLKGFRLRELVRRYSDYIGHRIEMPTVETEDPKKEPVFEAVNRANALWQRNPKDIEPAVYEEFYKHLSHDWEAPLARHHFKVEGTQMFAGLLFLPRRAPFDLFDRTAKHGVRLYVKRVFILDNCEDLIPPYLRFIKGVVDSEDLPLNVSRELLQDNRLVRVIKKQIKNHCLSMIEELERDRPDDFKLFWASFGAVLKEGLHYAEDAADKERIAKLVRYESTATASATSGGDDAAASWVSLPQYVSRMKEGQKAIYYATGASRALLEGSPHLERLKKQQFEVLFMTDPVDSFAVAGLGEFDGKSLVNVTDADLELDENLDDTQKQEREASSKEAEPLVARFKSILEKQVSEVRVSSRLTDSAVCLVTPEGGVAPHLEEILRAHNPKMPKTKRILELNPSHPVIVNLKRANDANPGSTAVEEWAHLLYDQALIAEGSSVEDPAGFAKRLGHLMQQAQIV